MNGSGAVEFTKMFINQIEPDRDKWLLNTAKWRSPYGSPKLAVKKSTE
jgi:hypothetical protein